MRSFVLCGLALGLAVAVTGAQKGNPVTARAELKDSQGQTIGTAELTDVSSGVLVRLMLTKAPAGVHGLHLHQVGKCDGPKFDSAGPHVNPAKTQHGFQNPQGPHRGDAPNLHVPSNGALEVEFLVAEASLGAGANSLLDADGAALVLHASADDYKTDPSGNSGDRIACGAVTR